MRSLPTGVLKQKNSYSEPRCSREKSFELAEIVSVTELRRVKKRLGQLVVLGLVSREGYCYSGAIALPNEPSTSVPVIGNSAWLTSLDGHNSHTIEAFMEAGNIVAFMGAEGSYHTADNHGGKLCDIRIAKSAATLLSFAGEILYDYAPEVDVRRIVFGESRGAMSGIGVSAFAQEFDQEVVYSDLIAPCFPRKFNPIRDTFNLYRQMLSEPFTVAAALASAPLEILTRYPSSFDPSPASLAHQIGMLPTLLSGEVGDLAQEVPVDTQGHITVFDDDWMSMHGEWEEIFAKHRGIRITPLPGSHLTIADKETRKFIMARNLVVQGNIKQKLPIISDEISAGAHKLVEASEMTLKLAAA